MSFVPKCSTIKNARTTVTRTFATILNGYALRKTGSFSVYANNYQVRLWDARSPAATHILEPSSGKVISHSDVSRLGQIFYNIKSQNLNSLKSACLIITSNILIQWRVFVIQSGHGSRAWIACIDAQLVCLSSF